MQELRFHERPKLKEEANDDRRNAFGVARSSAGRDGHMLEDPRLSEIPDEPRAEMLAKLRDFEARAKQLIAIIHHHQARRPQRVQ
jgi:hypothetical protein